MTVIHYTKSGTKSDKAIKLDTSVFGLTPNDKLLSQAYKTYLANGRTANAKTLTRGEVRGGGKKPWRQKGTGRARVGSSRVPNWRSGGVVFGATGIENYSMKMSTTTKRTAVAQALSLQASEQRVSIIETFVSEGTVKPTVQLLGKLGVEGTILLVLSQKDLLADRATRTIPGLKVVTATYLNVFDILNADTIIMTEDALPLVTAWLSGAAKVPAKKEAKVEAAS